MAHLVANFNKTGSPSENWISTIYKINHFISAWNRENWIEGFLKQLPPLQTPQTSGSLDQTIIRVYRHFQEDRIGTAGASARIVRALRNLTEEEEIQNVAMAIGFLNADDDPRTLPYAATLMRYADSKNSKALLRDLASIREAEKNRLKFKSVPYLEGLHPSEIMELIDRCNSKIAPASTLTRSLEGLLNLQTLTQRQVAIVHAIFRGEILIDPRHGDYVVSRDHEEAVVVFGWMGAGKSFLVSKLLGLNAQQIPDPASPWRFGRSDSLLLMFYSGQFHVSGRPSYEGQNPLDNSLSFRDVDIYDPNIRASAVHPETVHGTYVAARVIKMIWLLTPLRGIDSYALGDYLNQRNAIGNLLRRLGILEQYKIDPDHRVSLFDQIVKQLSRELLKRRPELRPPLLAAA